MPYENKHKVVMVAMACAPGYVSETGLAWKAILALHGHCESITIITHRSHQDVIESWLTNHKSELSNCRFIYIGEPISHHRNQRIARLLIWRHYAKWMQQVTNFITTNKDAYGWDVCHHVTFSTWRLGSPFFKTGLPTVWGPIGGGGSVPWRCLVHMSLSGKLAEVLRDILSFWYSMAPSLKQSLSQTTVILASNAETSDFLHRISKRRYPSVFPTWFESIDPPQAKKPRTAPLKLFTGGGIIASKGIALSILAISELKAMGVSVELLIAGYGPEKPYLEKLITSLSLNAHVSFLPLLSGDDYVDVLQQCEIFLFPSFRENIGMTMVEAMLHEQAPIVLNRSAPGEIVTSECGWLIDAADAESIIRGINDAIREAVSQPRLLRQKQSCARRRILENYSKQRYTSHILSAYEDAQCNHSMER